MGKQCCGHNHRDSKDSSEVDKGARYFLGLMGVVVAIVGMTIALNGLGKAKDNLIWLGTVLILIGLGCFLVALRHHLAIDPSDPGEE